MDQESQRDKIIEQLELLNSKMAWQNSVRRIFMTGVIYGTGFFIGSAVLATIALGILGPVLGKIGLVRNNYETGSSILKGNME